MNDRKSFLSHLVQLVKSNTDIKKAFPLIFLMSLFANILALALPLAILQIFDRVIINESVETLTLLAFGVAFIIFLEELLRYFNNDLTAWLGARFRYRTSNRIIEKLLQTPLRFFLKQEPGAYAEKIQTVSRLSDFYSGQALLALLDLPFIFIFLFIIYSIIGKLVLVPIAIMLVFTLILVFFGRWMNKMIESQLINEERKTSFLTEILSGILSVKVMSSEAMMTRRYERLKETSASQSKELFSGNALSSLLANSISQVLIVLVIFFGSLAVIQGSATPGALAACMLLSVKALQPFRRTLTLWLRFQSFIAGDKQFDEFKQFPGEPFSKKISLDKIKEGIELKDVSVYFDIQNKDKSVFEKISLKIPLGSCIAIKGSSGSGKSIFLSLLNGLEQANEGDVLIDGKDLNQFHPDSITQRIAFLPQTGSIFSGTLLENLTSFNKEKEKLALMLSEEMGLSELVKGMKEGYQTKMGSNSGEATPAGIKQLISIVRALVHEPDVILFDEANNSLDIESDKNLKKFFESKKKELTLIIVSSRPSWFRMADTTYHIEEKKIVEETEDNKKPFFNPAASAQNFHDRPLSPISKQDLFASRVFNRSDFELCLVPLLDKLGWDGTDQHLAEALPHLADHLDLSYFLSTLSNLGFKSFHYSQKSNINHLDKRILPCLLVPKDQSAMVLLEVLPNGHYLIFNSETNETEEKEKLESKRFDVYTFKEMDQDDLEKNDNKWVSSLLWLFKNHGVFIFAITILVTILNITPALFVRSVFDVVIPTNDFIMGVYLLIGTFLALAIAAALGFLRNYLMAHIGGRIDYILGSNIFRRIIRLPTNAVSGISVTRQIEKIKSLERFKDVALGPLALLFFELPAVIIILGVIVIINPWVSIVIIVSIIIMTAFLFIARPLIDRIGDESSASQNKRTELSNELLYSMHAIKASSCIKTWMQRFSPLAAEAAVNSYHEQKAEYRVSSIINFIGSLTILGVIVLSAWLAMQGQVTTGTLLATIILTWRIISPIKSIFSTLTSWTNPSKNLSQVNQLMKLNLESKIISQNNRKIIEKGLIDFNRVSFRYSAHLDPALLGLSFKVPVGGFLGITGPDGAGKSTLLNLICRIHTPQAGNIRIDSTDTRQVAVDQLRKSISYMTQNCDIFYGTIAQNLRLAYPSASDDELDWAIEMSGLKDDIDLLDQGLRTRISNSLTGQLSNGFRQRLSLARTLLKPAPVILMDEPGNGMDDVGEAALIRCINWLKGRSTLVLVTPRPSHLRMTDYILYLEAGSITARGPYKEVEDKIMAGLN